MFINVFTSHMNLRNSTGNSPNCVRFWMFFLSIPANLWVCWLGISIYDVLFPELLHFSIHFPTKIPPHPTNINQPPTTPHQHQPTTNHHHAILPTIPTTPYSMLTAQNNLGELFALLKFLWPDVMAKESEVWQVYRCCGWHTLPETGRWIFLFWMA